MFRNHVHSVNDRIVSLSQPEIRPIVCGKAKSPVEFGPKVDVSIADGVVDVERFSFDNFSESTDFREALNHYYDEHGFYPNAVLADMLYRTRKNIALCSNLGILDWAARTFAESRNMSIPRDGTMIKRAENRRGQVERKFAIIKGKLGLDLATSRTAETIAVCIDTAVVMANLAHNVFKWQTHANWLSTYFGEAKYWGLNQQMLLRKRVWGQYALRFRNIFNILGKSSQNKVDISKII